MTYPWGEGHTRFEYVRPYFILTRSRMGFNESRPGPLRLELPVRYLPFVTEQFLSWLLARTLSKRP